eukprot:CAMPEP_0171612366 /NCGR_PEP_ID=MMETSP0990-20121206/11165_1 /TAXON_ID=483369 /ORGANISM="non described non described, Strain CCMP2098" /LENGTH=238 /DNA_ID=CAMNT_0012176079 /DNA_START=188 /DNA_END=905 /DNA_ORIENTATION=+
MEEYDDLVPTPGVDGILELTYRGWNLVDDVVWTMGRELLVLNISFNSITEFPPELGDLMLLKELNCACNKVTGFPKQIGKLKHLKIIKANGNKITRIPDEIGMCKELVTINIGENLLQTVPATLCQCAKLEELAVCNNRLSFFPPAISQSPKLKKVDLTNNPYLQHMIPVKLQGNSDFILWMCAKWWSHDEESALVRACNKDYEAMIDRARRGGKGIIEECEKVHGDRRLLPTSFQGA